MRRYLFFALLLCLQWTVWGQATYDYRYWFDTDEGNQRTGSFAADSWHIDADLSGLDCSLHTIHIQVKDTAGVWSAPVTRHFIKMTAGSATGAYYWFNDDFARRQPLASVSGRFDIDVSALPESMHYFHYQANDGAGTVSTPQTAFFLKMPDMKTMKYRYWMDNDQSTMQGGDFTGGPMMIDVSEVADGFHIIYFQMEGVSGASVPANRMFIKIPQTENIGEMTCVCTIDGKLYKQEKVPSSGGLVDWTLDVSTLFQGLHRIQVQVLTPSGAASNVYDSFFFRTTMQDELKDMTLVYSVDGEAYQSQSGDFNTGMFHFDVDVASLEDGLHRLTYMLTSETGTTTKVSTAFFVKTPLGGPGIASYKYWQNDYEDEARFVKLAERKNPYELISLLPVDECPIRSTCFQFEVEEDGTPMVYAKNDIHLQFFDVSNRMAEAHKQYVDYNVGEAIEEITLLESGKRIYKAKPQDNKIYWFKVEAERGDSLTFKTDLAASIDVFNAKGDTLYHASGPDAVKFDGCRVDETATYYVALHDATAKNGTTIALDYVKIDKYAVLSYTPNEIGVLTETVVDMQFSGNGYDKLTNAYLQCGSDVFVPDTMFVFGKADMLLKYRITKDIPMGEYDAVMKFDDNGIKDSLVISKAIRIVEGIWQEAEITVSSERILAKPYPVKISIKNNSNVSMMYVPLNIAWEKPEIFESVQFENFVLPIDSAVYAQGYKSFAVTENFLGKGISAAVVNMFIPLLSPGETLELILGFSGPSHARFNVYAWTGKAFNHPNPIHDTLTNIPSVIDYYIDYVLDAVPFVQTRAVADNVVDIATDRARDIVFDKVTQNSGRLGEGANAAGNVYDIWNTNAHLFGGIINGIRYESFNEDYYGIDLNDETFGTFKDTKEKIGNLLDSPGNIIGGAGGALVDQISNNGSNIQNPEPTPIPNPIEILNPGDPNDIVGYTAESGSKYIKKDFTDIGYTIRFENDPALATAAAHRIVVTDTIDGAVHDLSTFTPTSIKIGDVIVELDGKKEFVQTIDLRPRINVIAQVTMEYSSSTGIAKWTIESLAPMTMEPTEDAMDGVLPVNSNGEGEGELAYDIRLKSGLAHGTEIRNRATIVFDMENAITTPDWVNVVDNQLPSSTVVEAYAINDSIVGIEMQGEDDGAGIWKYDLYCEEGTSGTWRKVAEVPNDSVYEFKSVAGIDYGFCVIATDSAGNVEQKELVREGVVIDYVMGDVNGDDRISIVDITMVTNVILKKEDEGFNAKAADLNADGRVSIVDATMITNLILKK